MSAIWVRLCKNYIFKPASPFLKNISCGDNLNHTGTIPAGISPAGLLYQSCFGYFKTCTLYAYFFPSTMASMV